MKKFVGYVNGKSFDNEKDFNKAAQEAIESGESNLAITSYYSYVDGDSDPIEDDGFVSTHEYFLGNREPENVSKDTVEYKLSDELKERLETATNKESIRENLDYHISKLNDSIDSYKRNIKTLHDDIEKLQENLYEKQDVLKDLNGRKEYYTNLINIVNDSQKKEKQVSKNDVKKLVGIDEGTSLISFLIQLGLLK